MSSLTDSIFESDEYVYLMLFKTESAVSDFDYLSYGKGFISNTTALDSSLSVSSAQVSNGQSVTFNLSTNAAENTAFDWSIAGVSSNDIVGNLEGTATVDENGQAAIEVTISNEADTSNSSQLTLTVGTQSASVDLAQPVDGFESESNDTRSSADSLTVGTAVKVNYQAVRMLIILNSLPTAVALPQYHSTRR